jgi:hypothetical protein
LHVEARRRQCVALAVRRRTQFERRTVMSSVQVVEAKRERGPRKGDAAPEKLQEIVEQSKARSAVFDVLTNGTAVRVTAEATRG